MRFDVTLVVSLAATTVLAAQQREPALKILSPAQDAEVSGATPLSADVTPADAPVRQVTFFVDGQQVCRLVTRPFTCVWNAGSSTEARTVRVVADLANGDRLAEAVRTRPRPAVMRGLADAIMVPVHVTNGDYQYVRGLQSSQFRILEDGVPQEISMVLVEDAPLNVLVALDISGSMAAAMPELKKAAGNFLKALRPGDSVTLAAFNDSLFLLSRPGADVATAQAALTRLRPSTGATALYDGIIQEVSLIKSQPSPRAIVVFTDGDDDASHATVDGARAVLQENDVSLYVIAQGKAAGDIALRAQWSRLAKETGGGAWFAPRMSALTEYFSDVVTDLTEAYVLAYSPRRPLGDGGWRQISVEVVDKKGVKVRSREGYLAVSRAH